jgi:UV DNA damage endonuclease
MSSEIMSSERMSSERMSSERMSSEKPIQLGLCCMNTTLKKKKVPVYASRRMIIRTIREQGIDELKRRILLNLEDLIKMIEWNDQNGIRVFRLSSELFPHKTNSKVEDYTFDFAKDHLKRVGECARMFDQRLTFHPGQYVVLSSPLEKNVKQSIKELDYHAKILELMGCDKNSVMVIHGGGVYGDKEKTIERWCENYNNLPNHIKNRLVLENCERSYSIEDCLYISSKTGVPIVFDTHHYDCYQILHPDEKLKDAAEYIPEILETWNKKSIKPKFHVSEQGSGKVGHHSDYIEEIPDYLLEIPDKYNQKIDIMIEAKKKELSIQKLYEKYPNLNCLN